MISVYYDLLLIRVYYHIIRIITFSDDNSVSSTLSVGDPNNNYYSEIKVHVRDFYNGFVVVTLPVTVIHNMIVSKFFVTLITPLSGGTQLIVQNVFVVRRYQSFLSTFDVSNKSYLRHDTCQ
jgi:hypothetical protein